MLFKQLFYKARYGGVSALFNKNALFKAVETGNANLVNHLLTKGNVNDKDSDGNTALLCAIKNNHHFIVKMLLEMGANKDIANNNDMTPFKLASANVTFAQVSLAHNYSHCMRPLLENYDVEITATNSFVDTMRWYINSLRTLHTLTNQQQAHLPPKITSNLEELSNNANSPNKTISLVEVIKSRFFKHDNYTSLYDDNSPSSELEMIPMGMLHNLDE